MITLRLGDRTEQFRRDFMQWLKENHAPRISPHDSLDSYVDVTRAWQAKLADNHWVAVHWPVEFGGRGLSIVEEAVGQECLASVGAPQLVGIFGLTMVGPVLIKYGTEKQKSRFLKRILRGDDLWCQGFSEPEAGSDLAALRTIGRREEGEGGSFEWSLTGQKIWTGFAQYADWCFILARTDTEVVKHKGLSYFLMSMKSPGIEVRPIRQITGEGEFNEVFLHEVKIPDENLVGKAGEGWNMAISTLMYERAVLTFSRHLQSQDALYAIRDLLRKRKDKQFSGRFGRMLTKQLAIRVMGLSHLTSYGNQQSPGPEGSLDKLAWSEGFQDICRFALDVQGNSSVRTGGKFSNQDGADQYRYLYSRGRTIAAGTSEIQRNIIAERLLGLPRLK